MSTKNTNQVKSIIKYGCSKLGYEINKIKHSSVNGENIISDIKNITNTNRLIIFDIGANEGQTYDHLRHHFPKSKYYLFEPSTAIYKHLEKKMKQRNNVDVYNFAVGNYTGTTKFYINEHSVMSSILDYTHTWGKTIAEENVQIISLDTFTTEQNISRIDLLKIDTQGYDLEVLKGSLNLIKSNLIHMINIEVLFVKLYEKQCFFEDIYSFLKQNRYKLVGLYNRSYHDEKYMKWADALFVNPCFLNKSN